MNIGIMGAQGSFSEEAAQRYLHDTGTTDATIVPLYNAARLLAALSEGAIEKAVFPIENSNGGVVLEAVHAMAAHRFSIERMFEIDVHHMLLVRKGKKTSDIATIASHDQALRQCRMYLKRVWGDAQIMPYEDTAKAAADLKEGVLPATTAVIAPRRCAALYDLEVLEASIQDLKFNYTTFIVGARRVS